MTSRIIPGRYPPPGTSPIADAIRVRRGPRGITPLDAALLHVPPVAGGWNSLLGAVRTGGNLPGDVRELIILRVAAINRAAFEWIQHEPVGRTNGLTPAQLYVVRDTTTPLPPSPGILSPLQTAALLYADASTRDVKIGASVTEALRTNLEAWAKKQGGDNMEEQTQDLLVEAAAVGATYNMVSRFLVALDVAGMSDDGVPWPIERKEHFITIPEGGHTIHAVTLVSSPTAPWIAFTNSLLTDLSMWGYLIPFLLASSDSTKRPYNILLHSQRGHGQSTLPSSATTIPSLATDLTHLLAHLSIPTPLHAVIGVSQGGAAALAVARSHAHLTRAVVACDTGPRTPAGNRAAWAGRVGLVHGVADGAVGAEDIWGGEGNAELGKGAEYAAKVGMGHLAGVTVPRWFPAGSKCATERAERHSWVAQMVERTPVAGFVAGAGALAEYDVSQADENGKELYNSTIERVLLVAGSLDGGGNVGKGLQRLRDEWNAVRVASGQVAPVEYLEITGAGHLPMVDETERFAEALRGFLDAF
ncbi:hypothetical protein H0H81_005248 [Sphagnurus paluster]|uniref:Uncharacterized protein n=1 Tax=Sphagnurus paluster TaxID=117069 RepID=A0A9P7FU14_9AGAR|nr:hypothetical protein H0H81_005248 [Sphagnurus paluster]